MKKIMFLIQKCIILIYCLLPLCMQGQRIVRVDVDSVACFDSVLIRVGFSEGNEIVVENLPTSLSHPGVAFLPDAIPCGSLGCSYRSPVTFSCFDSTATISSVNDINFVRLNIEHSYIGDIFIGITCPNGQRASLMNYSFYGSSDCSNSVPSEYCGWTLGYSVPISTYLGMPNDEQNSSQPCTSTAPGNEPGTGWNYCWSNNTENGYVYAGDDGIIYRIGNSHNGTIDSSDVAAGTQFYHPDQNFSSLIGCPLNGDWYIEVMDGWQNDNGYIFDWELSLKDSLIIPASGIASVDMVGNESTRVSDSSFLVSPPEGITSDTTVTYTVIVHTLLGEDLDTTFNIHYSTSPHITIEDHLCIGDTLWVDSLAITDTYQGRDTVYRGENCPIIRDFDVVFSPSFHFYDTVVFCYTNRYSWHDQAFPSPGDYDLAWQTASGCDSVWHVTIVGRDSGFVATPLISDNGIDWYSDTMLAGCRPMTIWLKSGTPHAVRNWWNLGDTVWIEGDEITHVYDTIGKFSIAYITESEHGCLDTAEVRDIVWVFGKPEAAFFWAPEQPSTSHPTAEFFNQSTSFTGGAIGDQYTMGYLWNIQTSSGYDSVREENPVYTWAEEGENVFGDFTVVLTAIQTYPGPYGEPTECEDTASATITIVNDWLQFPNLVSPNGDGTNDTWKVVNLLECGLYQMNELWIYNKWGTLEYHVQNIAEEDDFWDPEKTRSPDGTYFFRFSAKSIFGIVRTNGMIEVVR